MLPPPIPFPLMLSGYHDVFTPFDAQTVLVTFDLEVRHMLLQDTHLHFNRVRSVSSAATRLVSLL